MLISGIWHGAGYLFVLWGLLHGVYLVINHAWRRVGPKLWASKESYARFMQPVGFVLTFTSVAIAMVLFRSPTWHAAVEVFKECRPPRPGVAAAVRRQAPTYRAGAPSGVGCPGLPAKEFILMYLWLFAMLLIALLLPNSIQIMARYEPVLGAKERPANTACRASR